MRGCLVLIVGPSGAGKDTLLTFARDRLCEDSRFRFVRRTITRPSGHGEDHDTVALGEFRHLAGQGAFALHWEVHGLAYGLPASIVDWIQQGLIVVANGSRGALEEARKRFTNLTVINISAPIEVLAQRLERRGRETNEGRGGRILRGNQVNASGAGVIMVDNAGPPEEGGNALVRHLEAIASRISDVA